MKKTMIYLPEDTHEALRKMAFTHRVSIAELIRRAVDSAYGEDIEDIMDMEEAMKSSEDESITLEEYEHQRAAQIRS